MLGVLARDPARRLGWQRILIVTALGAALSLAVETLQLFMANRVTSVADVVTNTIGTAIGAIAAERGIRLTRSWLRRLRAAGLIDEHAFYPMMVAAIVVCLSAWQPFDVTIEVGTLVSKIKLLQADLWQFTVPNDEGVGFVQFALFAAAICLWLVALRRPAPATRAWLVASTLALGLEASQFLITSRMPGLQDMFVHIAGAAIGAGLWRSGVFRRRPYALLVVVSLAVGAGAAMQMLSPFTFASAHRPFRWLPFLGYYEHTSFETLSHVIELILICFPMGFCAARVLPPRRAVAWSIAIAAVLAVPIEYFQGWVIGRYPDVTDIIFSGVGAWLGAWAGGFGPVAFSRTLASLDRRRIWRPVYPE